MNNLSSLSHELVVQATATPLRDNRSTPANSGQLRGDCVTRDSRPGPQLHWTLANSMVCCQIVSVPPEVVRCIRRRTIQISEWNLICVESWRS
ncbi:hypothetical protein BaRGS_00004849 [Batillaria attramentaria]|uniref:Uncharacterized protein n=1 Tax=Batillaria attramentaria TaxID=370345 RepID=A0ABD0LW42_9CAEN